MSTLRGHLQSIALTDVIQLLHVNRKTGKLNVRSGEAQTGTLFVLNGEVIHAETPQTAGESAAFDILEWTTGEFEFIPAKFTVPTTLQRSVNDLMMEAARTSDSRKRLRGIFPDLRAVPWPAMPEPQLVEGLKLFPEDRKVIPYINGYRDFQDIIDNSGQSEVTVLQACLALKEAQRLQILEPALTLSVVASKTGFFKRGDHVELSKDVEAAWRRIGPYHATPIGQVRILWPDGPVIEQVRFVPSLSSHVIGIPKELMQSWGLPEGLFVSVRPASANNTSRVTHG